MVKARKRDEAEYPSRSRNKRDETEAEEPSDFGREEEGEESLEAYYYRQQGTVNRNEVIPTWRPEPPDRNAEPRAFDFETGYGPKETNWPWKSETQTVREAQEERKEQHKPDRGNAPSSMRRTGKRAP